MKSSERLKEMVCNNVQALEEALEEKADLEAQLLQDASRQTQLLDDFEWKLGEIERDCKKKIVDAEKAVEERIRKEMAAEYQQLVDDKRDIDEKLNEVNICFVKNFIPFLFSSAGAGCNSSVGDHCLLFDTSP